MDDDETLVFVNEDVQTLFASTGGNFGRRQDDQLDRMMDTASATFTVLLCQLLFSDIFAVAFLFPACEGLLLSSMISGSDGPLRAILVRLTYGRRPSIFLRLLRMVLSTSLLKMWFSVDCRRRMRFCMLSRTTRLYAASESGWSVRYNRRLRSPL